MIIVLDTNALVQIFGARSPFLALQQAILDGRVALAFSTAILLEYEEVLTRYGGPGRWPRVWQALEMTGHLHDNLRRVEPAYHWRLIAADPDDDKFADCAIAAEAEGIVTEDGHFDVLKHSGHKPQPSRRRLSSGMCWRNYGSQNSHKEPSATEPRMNGPAQAETAAAILAAHDRGRFALPNPRLFASPQRGGFMQNGPEHG